MADDAIPEERRDVVIPLIAGELVFAGDADDLRYLGVRVHVVERIDSPRERIENLPVLELRRAIEVLRLAGDRVEIGEHLVHAAELRVEHALLLFERETPEAENDPVRLLLQDVQRLRVA